MRTRYISDHAVWTSCRVEAADEMMKSQEKIEKWEREQGACTLAKQQKTAGSHINVTHIWTGVFRLDGLVG